MVSKLREAIEASGLSLNRISNASGVGRDRLSRFVRGERDLTLSAAERICEALGWGLTRLTPAVPDDQAAAEPPAPKRRRKGG